MNKVAIRGFVGLVFGVLGPVKLKSKHLTLRYFILAGNFVAIVVVIAMLLLSGRSQSANHTSLSTASGSSPVSNPLDTVSSSDIAETLAHITNLPEITAVHNQADSADAKIASPLENSAVVSKPLVMGIDLKSKADIQEYTSLTGDTIAGLARKFNVTSDSIRWSNDLASNSVASGKKLLISPISDGVVYKVQAGDTPDTLAKKFRADKDKIVAFNDAEVAGLKVDELVVIPGGNLPVPTITSNALSSLGGGFAWGGDSPVYGASGYDFGQCTYYAALRRAQIGKSIPSNLGNAITWVSLAQKAGLSTGKAPRAGAIIWTPPTILSNYYAQYGHVGFVEAVLADGTVKVSDMNVKGWNVISQRALTPEQASAYSYIY